MRVVIYVSGGNVQTVYSDSGGIDVVVLDEDNAKVESKEAVEQMTAELQSAQRLMKQVY